MNFPWRLVGDVDIIDPNAAMLNLPQTSDGFDQLALTVAGNAGDTEDFVSINLEGDSLYDRIPLVAIDRYVFYIQNFLFSRHLLS